MSSTTYQYTCALCGANREAPVGDAESFEAGAHMWQRALRIICPTCDAKRNRAPAPEPKADLVALEIKRVIPDIYQDTDKDRLPSCQFMKCRYWAPAQQGLYLYGPTQRCKSRIAYWLARKFIELKYPVVAFDCRTFRGTVEQKIQDGKLWPWMQSLERVPVLLLDDLGKFKGEGKRIEEELFSLVKMRSEARTGVIITSQHSLDELARKFSPDIGIPMVERLRRACLEVSFYTEDEARSRPALLTEDL